MSYTTGCLMLKVDIPHIKKLLRQIRRSDIQQLELEQHITILYGFNPYTVTYEDVVDALKEYPDGIGAINFEITGIGVFENDVDVLKLNVRSKQLKKLHKYLKKRLDNEYSYGSYLPHITLAYLEKGTGRKYVRDFSNIYHGYSNEFNYSEPAVIDIVKGDVFGKAKHVFTSNDLREMIFEMARKDLKDVDKIADYTLSPEDIKFTNHFFDRVNDKRNGKPITKNELIDFFYRLSKDKEKLMVFLNKFKEVVVTDRKTKINIPFVKTAEKILAKTIMRKQNFLTNTPKLTFEKYE